MTKNEYLSLKIEEKKDFITNLLKELKDWSDELTNLYNFFRLDESVTEEDCDEVYNALLENA